MQNLNPEERNKILNEIINIKEQIWETKSYIDSDLCKRCSEMYSTLFILEQHLKGLQNKISDGDS